MPLIGITLATSPGRTREEAATEGRRQKAEGRIQNPESRIQNPGGTLRLCIFAAPLRTGEAEGRKIAGRIATTGDFLYLCGGRVTPDSPRTGR